MVSIRKAETADAPRIADLFRETAQWLEHEGMPLWVEGEIMPERVIADVLGNEDGGVYFIAECSGEIAGALRFQIEDERFWPDVPRGESGYLHRFTVRRRFAGGGISTAMLQWAVEHARGLGRRWLRLDCEASRPRLRAVYERFGFRHHSDRQVGSYFVARYEYPLANQE